MGTMLQVSCGAVLVLSENYYHETDSP